ncbi:MAG: hypothetical protein ACKOJB_04580 [Chthoniobacterales bacterium]
MIRLVADANLSRKFVRACLRLDKKFPLIHLADWMDGKHRVSDDPVLLGVLREQGLILVSFDRRTMAAHAGALTRAGAGHAGVILFRRSVSPIDYGKQSRLLVEFWRESGNEDWADRIAYLPQ